MPWQKTEGATGVFFLENSDCAGCADIIRRSLLTLKGVREVAFNYVTDKVYVNYDPARVSPGEIRSAIERAGDQAAQVARTKLGPRSRKA